MGIDRLCRTKESLSLIARVLGKRECNYLKVLWHNACLGANPTLTDCLVFGVLENLVVRLLLWYCFREGK